jgi:5'-3' exonuclease
MGIPSYFSHVVKNHGSIVQKFTPRRVNNLYLDSNSIVYDVVNKLETKTDATIINGVITKLEEYIALIKPTRNILIAFDGVAPLAKMDQQRQRRYKSKPTGQWNTTAITPGTDFMNELNYRIRRHFTDPAKYGATNIVLSLSDRAGEGEHKLFQYIRDFPEQHKEDTTVVYGLDADLIMLSLNHVHLNSNIFLFREAPHFMKDLEPESNYVMDIRQLSQSLGMPTNDYLFICFFLGNDFMPHFPAANIRTGGLDKMQLAYTGPIVYDNGGKIKWANVRTMVQRLADQEEAYLLAEMKLRDKHAKRVIEDAEELLLPMSDRRLELYINPGQPGWQERYYKALFDIDIDDTRRKQICVNYLEGLEWTMKYYTKGCADWRWSYKYDYPPLFCDLVKYVPRFDMELVTNRECKPVSPTTQLSYVLPKTSLNLLPPNVRERLLKTNMYAGEGKLVWAFCKYTWEAHVQLPDVDIDELEKILESK